MTSISKNVCIDKLAYKVNEYKNTYHITIKMKPAYVRPSTYIDLDIENNNKDSKFEVGDHVNRGSFIEFVLCGWV